MKNTFTVSQLVGVRNESQEEQIRTRKIFDILKERAKNNEYLSEHEKEFFCTGVELSLFNDGKWEDYACCENPKFKYKYLTYFTDISGGGKYYDIKGTSLYQVPPDQSQKELIYLYEKAQDWDTIVQKNNHTEELLKQICTETRNDLKNLDRQPEFFNNPVMKGTFYYKYKRIGILLRSRYIYCKSLEILESLDPKYFIYNLNDETIEFNEYSLIHIVSRHFAEITQQYKTGKSYHSEDFIPSILSPQLKFIFEAINQSRLLINFPLEKLAIQFKGQNYHIWTSVNTKSVKGQGNVSYRRLDTFYPVTDFSELQKLQTEYSLQKIDNDLSLFVPVSNL